MNLLISITILFIVIITYFSISNRGNKNNLKIAGLLAVSLSLLGLLPNFMGIAGWIIAIVLSLYIISKSLGETISGSLLFFIGVELVSYIVSISLNKFL